MRKVRHVVLVKFRSDIGEAEREKFLERVKSVRALSFVTGLVSGWGFEPNQYDAASEPWDWGFTLDLDEDDVVRYATDSLHRSVGEEVGGLAEKYAILDFVVDQ